MNTGFLDRISPTGSQPYQVYVPRHYSPDRRWPVVLFLHGAGEGGDDGLLQTEFQLGSAIRRHSDLFEALAVFPQQRPSCYWSGDDLSMALDCLEQTCREFNIDPARQSLCGVSSGAIGAWALASRHPHRIARLLIVSGLVGPASFVPADGAVVPAEESDPHRWLAQQLQRLPSWIHHGAADPLYAVEDARRTVACLRALQAPVRYSELPGFGHNVWDAAFYSEPVLRWLVAPAAGSRP
jgi:predicted peptidase